MKFGSTESTWCVPLINDREGLGVLPVLLHQSEETGLADSQYLLNLGSIQQPLAVAMKQHFDLVICKALVQLSHFALPYRKIDLEGLYHDRFTFQLERVHFSALNLSVRSFLDQLGKMQ
jgi:hypothetical protein